MSLPKEAFLNPTGSSAWDTDAVHAVILAQANQTENQSVRTTERALEQSGLLPKPLTTADLRDEHNQPARSSVVANLERQLKKKRYQSLILQVHHHDHAGTILMVNDGRKGRRWYFVGELTNRSVTQALIALCAGKSSMIWPHGKMTPVIRQLVHEHGFQMTLDDVQFGSVAYPEPAHDTAPAKPHLPTATLSHLDRLEAESIFIIREVLAIAENPVMLYSIGKDSSVMLHLARKAFYPGSPPFPLLHVDTRWKFRAMYQFRDAMAKNSGMDLLVHINPEGVDKDINPFDHGSSIHTDIMKTQGLKQALDHYQFDAAFGGARRDEEKSRAKERVFSFRSETYRWDPKNQRPELWNLYNGFKKKGESMRIFPLSNWTELDIWQYIFRENIPIVPLYFAAPRPVVERDGMLILVDDDRIELFPDEVVQIKNVRFRTLGCYPLTGAVESDANDLSGIVLELLQSKTSERQGRAIDSDSSGSMEKKKQEGYF